MRNEKYGYTVTQLIALVIAILSAVYPSTFINEKLFNFPKRDEVANYRDQVFETTYR